MRVIIAGGRDFDNWLLLCNVLDGYGNITQIVSGAARGADQMGERYAQGRSLPVARFPANWDLYGKRAGFLRNVEMANNADALVAFWDGSSRGTKHMIDTGRKCRLLVSVVPYNVDELV